MTAPRLRPLTRLLRPTHARPAWQNSPRCLGSLATKFALDPRFGTPGRNMWVEFNQLAAENDAVHMGQGFPDCSPPAHMVDTYREVLAEFKPLGHQYARAFGHVRLVNALSRLYSPLLEHNLDPMTNIISSLGAFGSLYYSITSLINPGDEAIIIEPYFDCYTKMVRAAGGTPRCIQLRQKKWGGNVSSADWELDPDELRSMFNHKTKLIIVNTPHNPTGKVFTLDELTMIADLCKQHNVICIADDVYEWLVYDKNQHIRMATLPGMWERTLTIGSAGKTFNATGWRLGWTMGPEHLMKLLHVMVMLCTYSCPTIEQEVMARGLETEIARLGGPDSHFVTHISENQPKRDRMVRCLSEAGFRVTVPQSGFFLLADFTGMGIQTNDDSDDPEDFKFARWLTCEKKLSVVPPSAFYYDPETAATNYIRVCFIKKQETLEAAETILGDLKIEQDTGRSARVASSYSN